ncbi:MAG: PEP-utilizing enzyme, partial [Gammaproteobacteria bacterium]|nr:PEP-utilizing enzyme [Gammaproteobacteria bacterium]
PACVILETKDFHMMQPGCVLVCPTTNPAWTPLFPLASALVTDIGGLLAHGSIIAREYGIPAVLGLGDATRKIKSGDMLTVDGNHGSVHILND